jgi:hypothetical protein
VILAAEAAPHLVHHAFDEGGEQPDCVFLVAADHAPAAADGMVMVAVAHVLLPERIDPPRSPVPAAIAIRTSSPRGPPLAPLAFA